MTGRLLILTMDERTEFRKIVKSNLNPNKLYWSFIRAINIFRKETAAGQRTKHYRWVDTEGIFKSQFAEALEEVGLEVDETAFFFKKKSRKQRIIPFDAQARETRFRKSLGNDY